MAMLRNLRNVITANVQPKYHNMIIGRLSSEKAVVRFAALKCHKRPCFINYVIYLKVGSRQFPFRFFSAYEVLSELVHPKPQKERPDKHKVCFIINLQNYFIFFNIY
jgi:telomerase protein component 1